LNHLFDFLFCTFPYAVLGCSRLPNLVELRHVATDGTPFFMPKKIGIPNATMPLAEKADYLIYEAISMHA
jgi:hypothetical protein